MLLEAAGDIRNAFRHEALHMFGAAHTGEYDSRDGYVSTLKSCSNNFNVANILPQDDAISLQYVSDSGAYRTFSADPGFESNRHYYGLSGGGSATLMSGGGASGNYRMRYTRTGSGQSVYSTTRAMLGATNDSYVARGQARAMAGSETSHFYMQLWSRWVEYPHNTPPACTGFTRPNIYNPDGQPTNVGTLVKREEDDPVSLSATSWASSASGLSPYFDPNPVVQDAHDLQWRAVATAYDSDGDYMPVELDNLRVESS